MTTTDHQAIVEEALDHARTADVGDDENYHLSVAQVHATLAVAGQTAALAAEARTANQLALAALLPPGSPMRDALLDDVHRALTEDVTP